MTVVRVQDLFGASGEIIGIDPRVFGRVISMRKPRATQRLRVLGSRVTSYLGAVNAKVRAGKQVAVVDVIGPLVQRSAEECFGYVDGYDNVAKRVMDALEDRDVEGVVIRIDSPGGYVAGCEEAIKAIIAVRDDVKKPVATFVDELAASAAYWLVASVANAGIYAPVSGEVGSIGVYSMLADERGRLEQEGIAVKIVREPAGKDAANPLDPVADVALSRERDRVREIANRFYSSVAASRGLSADAVRALDGSILGASQALRLGLIDKICSFDEALIAAVAAHKETGEMAKNKRAARRARAMRAAHQFVRRAEDTAPIENETLDPPSDRATAAQVSAAASACATACSDCESACDGGTADEAIASVSAMLDACATAISVGQSFLGEPASDDVIEEIIEDAPEATEEDEEQEEEKVSRTGARVIRLLESIERDRAKEQREAARRADAAERASLIAGRKMNNEIRAWLQDPRTPIAEVRAACRALPESYDGYLAADVSVCSSQRHQTSLPDRVLAKCRRLGIDPEKYLETKRAIAQRSGGAQ